MRPNTPHGCFPDAEKAENLPRDSDFVLAQSHLCTDTILLRLHGRLSWKIALRPQGADPEYTLCRLLYTLLGEATGSTPPWGMMTGVRPVRIIHDMRASGATEDEIRARFLDHFACTPEKFALALGIADLQKPVLDAAEPMDCSVYAASRSARRGAAIAALSPARWGTRRPAPSSSPMWTSSARS